MVALKAPYLIGLTGSMYAGKDTAFKYIQEWAEERGEKAQRQGFADRLKLSAARIFYPDIGLEDAIAWCNGIKNDPDAIIAYGTGGFDDIEISGRTFLQRYGTEAHRDVFEHDFWVNALLPPGINNWVTEWDDDITYAVVTDVRFPNEAKAIRNHFGEVWYIYRPDVEAVVSHASEAGVGAENIDFQINNDKDLDYFRKQVRYTMQDTFG